MNANQFKQLLAAARQAPAPTPPEDFAGNVLRTVRRDSTPLAPLASLWDHLNALFPRAALAALALIVICAAADWTFNRGGANGLADDSADANPQSLLDMDDL